MKREFSIFNFQFSIFSGFTLVEMLVVISVLSVAGMLILTVFTNSLRGSNKSQIIGVIKQNGQAVLETMDKTIRDADNLVCVSNDTLVSIKDGNYTRYKFITTNKTTYCGSENGCVVRDFPVQPSTGDKTQIRLFLATICTEQSGTDSSTPEVLTDTNKQTGVSIIDGLFTRPDPQPGFKDVVSIKFKAKPGVGAPAALSGQIDDVEFQTTIQLR